MPPIDPLTMIVLPVVINFVTGRMDAKITAPALDSVITRFGRRTKPVNHDLQKALQESFFLALQDIAKECRQHLHQSSRVYRGIGERSDIQWLDRKIKDLEKALKQVEQQVTLEQSAMGFRLEIEALIHSQGQPADCLNALQEKLWTVAPPDEPNPPECYKIKVQTGLLERVYDYFSEKMKQPGSRVFTAFMLECQDHLITSVDSLPAQFEEILQRKLDELKQQLQQPLNIGQPQAMLVIEVQSSVVVFPANPFIPLNGGVDDPQMIFGREREIKRVFETLNSGSSVALIGEREIGKSSLLSAIIHQAQTQLQQPRQPIYLNMQNIYDEEDFYEAFCDQVKIPLSRGYRLSRALETHRLLLILDEAEKISWQGFTNQVRGQLRGLAEGTQASLRLVVAACTSLDRLFTDSQTPGLTSPFTGICIEEIIKPWDEITARALIASRLDSTPVRFTEAEIAQILQESGRHPKKLMQLCHHTYNRYRDAVQ